MALLFLLLSFIHVKVQADPSIYFPEHDPIVAVENWIRRELGSHYLEQFELRVLPPTQEGIDTIQLQMINSRIQLAGTTGTALASAFLWYLKLAQNTQRDWFLHRIRVGNRLHVLTKSYQMKRTVKYSYYLNVCTLSYSMWSWNWKRWERHIDWMAMNGINMPLAFTGQEKVWQATFQNHFNISTAGLEKFFAGAAFLAWGRMGNVRGSWGRGPLPRHFIDDQYQLQLKILARMKQFGMLPAMPAFSGHIPEELTMIYPQTNFSRSFNWGNFPSKFCCVYLLEATDPLFRQIGRAFIQEQKRLYPDASSLYQCDTFNEMNPRSFDSAYLSTFSKAVIESITTADPKGVWLMQGWLFQSNETWTNKRIKAYLSGVPNDRMIILDLYSEVNPVWKRSHNYYGKSWIYCVLHNFGGNLNLRGDLSTIAADPLDALAKSNGTMVGIGLTMEGIFQNYVVYDLLLEMAWRKSPVETTEWIQGYARRRYQSDNYHIQTAWSLLASSVYNCTKCYGGVTKNVLTLSPRWKRTGSGFMPRDLAYDPKKVIKAWSYFLQAAIDLKSNDVFQHDLVDITRQVLSDRAYFALQELNTLYHTNNTKPAVICRKVLEFNQLIHSLDRILATNENFLLGKWLDDARALGHTKHLQDYFEYEARNQITQWGEQNHETIADYASKQWAGLVKGYYGVRWSIFLSEACSSAMEKRHFDFKKVEQQRRTFEYEWQYRTQEYPTEAQGDPVLSSAQLYHQFIDFGILSVSDLLGEIADT